MEVVNVQDNKVRAAVVVDVSDRHRRPLIPEGIPVRNVLPGGPAPDPPDRVECTADPEAAIVSACITPAPHLEDHESELLRPEVGHRDAGTLVLIGGPVRNLSPRPPRI